MAIRRCRVRRAPLSGTDMARLTGDDGAGLPCRRRGCSLIGPRLEARADVLELLVMVKRLSVSARCRTLSLSLMTIFLDRNPSITSVHRLTA